MKYLFCLFVAVCFFDTAHANSVYLQFDHVVETAVTATTASTQWVAPNQSRGYLLIQNNGATNIIVKFGSTISASEGTVIQPGGSYEPSVMPIESVWIKTASSTDSVAITEGNVR